MFTKTTVDLARMYILYATHTWFFITSSDFLPEKQKHILHFRFLQEKVFLIIKKQLQIWDIWPQKVG